MIPGRVYGDEDGDSWLRLIEQIFIHVFTPAMQPFGSFASLILNNAKKGTIVMKYISIDLLSQVNYWAVLTSGLVAFILGGLWYSPVLFEGRWMTANGYSQAEIQETLSAMVPFGFAGALLAYVLMALVFALFSAALSLDNVRDCVILGVVLWFGFVASSGLTITLFSPRVIDGWLIDAGFQFTFLVVIGAILGAWR